jgi:hypothetical protein
MINIYTDKSKIPSNMEYIHDNDVFFMKNCVNDTKLNRLIIKEIDEAEYCSKIKFIDRSDNPLYIDCLSMGSKILINAGNNLDKVFNACELGENALNFALERMCSLNLYFPNKIPYEVPDDTDISEITLNGKAIKSVYELD